MTRQATRLAAAALGAALVLSGCTPMEWIKPDATPQERDQDASACQQDAWREARWRAWYYRPFPIAPFRDASGRFFFPGPSGYFSDPFGDPYLEEGRLAQFCMRNKGYQLAPVEPGG